MSTTDSRIDAAHENLRESFAVLGRALPNGEIHERDGATLVLTGQKDAELNRLFVGRPPTDAGGLLAWTAALCRSRGARWMVLATPAAATALAAPALALDHAFGRPTQTLLLAGLGALQTAASPPGLEFERVDSPALADTFTHVMADGFGAPASFYAAYAAPGVWDAPSVRHYLGWYEDEAVATAAAVRLGTMVGIYHVSTVPEFRRRGIGEAITRFALTEAAAEGATIAALQPTTMSFRVYQRLGFRSLFSYSTWYGR